MKILFATTNPAKVKYYVKELQKRNVEVITLKDLDINLEVEENGKDAIENAIIKAKAYYKATNITTIAIDDNLFLEGLSEEEQPKTNVRRINGKRLTDEEIIPYYTDIIHKLGRKVNGYWLHGIAICKENKIATYQTKSELIFVDKPSKIIPEGYPLDGISIEPKFNKYLSELTQEEKEQRKGTKNKELFDYIIQNI